jgi:hypothetical protein
MAQQGASIPGWDLSQYPNTGSPTANIPVPIDQQIAALINGGGLTGADKLAKISDIKALIEANAYQVTPAAFGANNGQIATMQSLQEKNMLPALVKNAAFSAIYLPEAYLAAHQEVRYSFILSAAPNAVISTPAGLLEIVTGLPACATTGMLTGLALFTPGWIAAGNPISAAGIQYVGGKHNLNNGISAATITAPTAGGLIYVQGSFLINIADAVP